MITKTEMVPIESIKPYGKNPRQGNVSMIKESLEHNQQYRAIVVRRATKEILAGNHTWIAARELKWDKILVHWVDVDDDQARKIVLVDNKSNDAAGYDKQLLASLLQEADDLIGTGYTQAEIDKMLDQDTPPDDPDPKESMGDLEFRVIVDCRDEEHQADLMGRLEAEGLNCRPLMS